ncbi:MAG: hypothetical protein WDZ82_01690 [Candidatus Paceibacterota bacterium]
MEKYILFVWHAAWDPIERLYRANAIGSAFIIAVGSIIGFLFLPITIGIFLLWLTLRYVSNKTLRYTLSGLIVLITAFVGTTWIYVMITEPSLDAHKTGLEERTGRTQQKKNSDQH